MKARRRRAHCGALRPRPGVDDRARTGDLDLGKVALYQLSYIHKPPDAGVGLRAPSRNRTGDLLLTMEALYQLS